MQPCKDSIKDFLRGGVTWEGRTVPTKSLFEQEAPQNWNPEVFEQTRCSRILHVEFPQNNRELVKAEVFEKRVFEQTAPFKRTK